jgi:polyisoprenoid-binding protein YceI
VVKLPGSPDRKRMALYASGAALAVILAGAAFLYFVVFPTSSPAPFKLASTGASTSTASTTASSTTASATTGTTTSLAGSYSVASGSKAGYRVREKLAFLPAESDAVGRTSQITGTAIVVEQGGSATISSASFNVAVNTLTSDRSMRDEKIHEIGLESSRYPTATFVLSGPVTLPKSISSGQVVRVSATGVFTIHGVAKKETLPIELAVSGGTLQAVGSLTFPWSEFGMTAPSVGGFVNVTEHATMEFDLRLARA